jgi:hypothetical protein
MALIWRRQLWPAGAPARIVAARPPRSTTTTLFTAGRYLKVVSKTVDARGHLSLVEYRVAPDGEEVPVRGARAYDRLSMKSNRYQHHRGDAPEARQGRAVSTRVMSADGRTATITTVGADERGQKIHDVAVFERP